MRISEYGRNTLFCGALALLVHGLSFSSVAQTATISVGTSQQTIDGFGGENGGPWSAALGNTMSGTQADQLFSPTVGIGISIYRMDSVDGTSATMPPDISAAQAAVARGAQVELTIQGPPSSMKYSGSWGDGTMGASGSCVSVSWSTYAAYMVGLIQNLQANGVPVTWIDVQNEPNDSSIGNGGFGRCLWSASALDAFIKVLGPALNSAGLSSKVILGSAFNYSNSQNYFNTCVQDSGCNQYLSVLSGHGYGFPDKPVLYSDAGKRFWLSETSPNNDTSFNAGMTDTSSSSGALTMAMNIHNFLVSGHVSGYEWWELAYVTSGSCANCQLIDQNWDLTKRFYAFGNWSKFVRPGMVMVGATNNPQPGVYVTAFLNQSTGSLAIVAINTNGSSVSQTFNVSGPSLSSVIPYVTDPSTNLANESSLSVADNSFTTILTSSSVTTFVCSTSGPGAPTNLIGTIVQ